MVERFGRLLGLDHTRKGGRHSPRGGRAGGQRPGFFNRVSEFLFLQQEVGRVVVQGSIPPLHAVVRLMSQMTESLGQP